MKGQSLRTENLSKSFADVLAVDDVSLFLPEGEILSILGASGCGKTTLLRLIAGFEQPDAGTIQINSTVVDDAHTHLPPEERRVGMVFQEDSLFPHLTVEQNIAFGIQDRSPGAIKEVVEHFLAMVGLIGLERRYPHELSGGESQRIALARALAPEPVVLLMDEPFSSLDADRRVRIRDQVRFILKQTNATALFVTHDQDDALFMADSLAVMEKGSIIQLDSPELVFSLPARRETAEFLGHAEFLPAVAGERVIETELGRLDQISNLETGTEFEIGFRADDVAFKSDPSGTSMILARYFKGGTTLYRLRLKSGRIIHSSQPHYIELQPGVPVRAWLAPNHPLPCYVDDEVVHPQ